MIVSPASNFSAHYESPKVFGPPYESVANFSRPDRSSANFSQHDKSAANVSPHLWVCGIPYETCVDFSRHDLAFHFSVRNEGSNPDIESPKFSRPKSTSHGHLRPIFLARI